ncbi:MULTISPECIES: DUF924 family protein [unclassified Sinorhizobium]|uniref:DUF924 family protein n=1 Tax=unclassified Sinorhizobium TaxID=2613772 RepID=UPI0035269D73
MSWMDEWDSRLNRVNSLDEVLRLASLMGDKLSALGMNPPASAGAHGHDPVSIPSNSADSPPDAVAVVEFWRAAGFELWFAKDEAFDRRFREQFIDLHEAAACDGFSGWLASPVGSLALLILLDQFPRNAFRGSPRMYATDPMARKVADIGITAGHDQVFDPPLRLFYYLPFAHSEDMADQERSVALCRRLGEPHAGRAKGHHDIVERFGRFPHRNHILQRTMTDEEELFLKRGGFSG